MKWVVAAGFAFLAWNYWTRHRKQAVIAECCHMGDSR